MRPSTLDSLTNTFDFMGGQVVHDHDISRHEFGRQDLLDIGLESGAVHGAIENHGSHHSGQPQTGGEGCGFPVTVGNGSATAFTTSGPPSQARHLGRGACLINEDQLFRGEIDLSVEPELAAGKNVRALLFAGVRRLFL